MDEDSGRPDSTRALLLRGARLGLDGAPVDLRIEGGVIAEIAPVDASSSAAAAAVAAETVDVAGTTVLRGLWDRHVHSRQWALHRNSVDVSGAGTAAEAAALVAAAAPPTGVAGAPVLAYGAAELRWPDTLHKDLLAGVRAPVLVLTQDLHTAWLNQAALERIGAADHSTGVLRERACFAAAGALTAAAAGDVERWIAEAMHAAARRGVVGILDLEMADNVAEWSRRAALAPLPVRVVCGIPRARLGAAVAAGLRSGAVLADPQLTVGPVKVFVDGSLGSRTALCHAAYPGGHDHGRQELAPDELTGIIAEAAAHGLAAAVHAIGDHANTLALDAFERAGTGGRIEHAQLLTPADVPRFAELGVTAGVQPAHLDDDRDLADELWRGHTGGAYAYASLHRAGATLEFGSDAPVTPLDPWRSIAAAVGRAGGGRPPWHPEQRLSPAAALDCSTLGRATPRASDAADLVLVSGLGPDTLAETDVHGTLVAGRWTFRR